MAVKRGNGRTNLMEVTIQLKNYWYEQITKDEAMRRLQTRTLSQDRFGRIRKSIPETMDHFLIFNNGFREYVRVGEGPARLLLMLPTIKSGKNKYKLACPMVQTHENPQRWHKVSLNLRAT